MPGWTWSSPETSTASFKYHPKLNHIEADRRLACLGLTSAYHEFFQEKQGEETRPTHHFYRRADRPFHIDYAYVPNAWLPGLSVQVGPYEEWGELSDHCPLIVMFALEVRAEHGV